MPQPLTVLAAPELPAQAELDRLRARVEAGGPEAVRAALALLERGLRDGDLEADADRLLALARRPSTRPELAGLIAAPVAVDVRARVNVAAVRAFAALDLGDVAQARRLVDAASRVDAEAGLLPLARLAVERAERQPR